MKTHKDLLVYQLSMDLVEEIYRLANKFPKHEMYGLTNQMRRSSVSIPSNIAEGASRISTKDFIKFLYYSLSSLAELETQIMIAKRIGYMGTSDLDMDRIEHLRRMLINLIKSLKSKV
jgi:four helix bundle protein